MNTLTNFLRERGRGNGVPASAGGVPERSHRSPSRVKPAEAATPYQRRLQAGGSLIVTLIVTGVLGIALVAYLGLVSSNQQAVVRDEAWNGAIPVAEAGVEEALAHLNKNYPTNLLHAGWSLGTGVVEQQRALGDTSYRVSFTPATFTTILSTGYVRIPWNNALVSRAVRVTALHTGVVNKSLFVRDGIRLNGNPIRTDSYDSSSPFYSGPNGRYDPAKAKDGGDIALLSDQPGAFSAGNSKIYGKVSTGENSYVDVGSLGSIGSQTWINSGSTGIEPGWFSDDAMGEMPDVNPPYATAPPPPGFGVMYDGEFYTVLPWGQYQASSFGGKVLVIGNVTLVVTDRVQFAGTDIIRILPGSSLRLYVAATSASIGGRGVVNESGQTTAFTYYGLPSNKYLAISGGGNLAGLIYAPQAQVTLNGGGHVYGGVVAREVVMNGATSIHLDEALNRLPNVIKHFVIKSWDEI